MNIEQLNSILFGLLVVFVATTCLFLALYLHERKQTKAKTITFSKYYTGSGFNKQAPSLHSLTSRGGNDNGGGLTSGGRRNNDSPTRQPTPKINGIQVGYIRGLNPSHFFSEEQVIDMINQLNTRYQIPISIATEDEIMQEHVRPLQSVFWYFNTDTQKLGTSTKYNSLMWRPQKYKSATEIAVTCDEKNCDLLTLDSILKNSFQLEFIPASF